VGVSVVSDWSDGDARRVAAAAVVVILVVVL
jgi:hypothetical protein